MTRARAVAGGRREERCLFDAVLRPNASLGRRGFLLLMTGFGAVSLGAGLVFASRGAWPVTGFFGLDAALLYVLFRANRRAARLREIVRLSDSALTVERVAPSGRSARWRFQPRWLRVECRDESHRREALVLSSHGRSLVIGAFLAPEERRDLARALNDALARWRRPRRSPAPAD